MTLSEGLICFAKKPALGVVFLKHLIRHFLTLGNNEKGSAQAPGLQRVGLLTGSPDVLLFLLSVYLSRFPVEYFPTPAQPGD